MFSPVRTVRVGMYEKYPELIEAIPNSNTDFECATIALSQTASMFKQGITASLNFSEAFANLNSIVHGKIPYTLIGAMARNYYLPPRATLDIDLLFLVSVRPRVIAAFEHAGYKVIKEDSSHYVVKNISKGLDLDLLFTNPDEPYSTAVHSAKAVNVFGTKVNMCAPEMLVWLYLTTDQMRHVSDAQALLKSGKVNTHLLYEEMQDADDDFSIELLSKIQNAKTARQNVGILTFLSSSPHKRSSRRYAC